MPRRLFSNDFWHKGTMIPILFGIVEVGLLLLTRVPRTVTELTGHLITLAVITGGILYVLIRTLKRIPSPAASHPKTREELEEEDRTLVRFGMIFTILVILVMITVYLLPLLDVRAVISIWWFFTMTILVCECVIYQFFKGRAL